MGFIDKRNCGIFASLLLIAVALTTSAAAHRPAWVSQPRLSGIQSSRLVVRPVWNRRELVIAQLSDKTDEKGPKRDVKDVSPWQRFNLWATEREEENLVLLEEEEVLFPVVAIGFIVVATLVANFASAGGQ